jgi:hypothetical protein
MLAVMVCGGVAAHGQEAAPAQDAAADSAKAAAKNDESEGITPAEMCRSGLTMGEIEKGVRFPSYVEDGFPQLLKEVPALRGLKFEADPAAEPDKSNAILSKTGETITQMLPRVPNLIAREELTQALVKLPYVVSETTVQNGAAVVGSRRNASQLYDSTSHVADGPELEKTLDVMIGQGRRTSFGYRIQSIKDPTFGTMLSEYRTNGQNEAVEVLKGSADSPRGVGFSAAWMMFKPANVDDAKFRYLGHQKIGKRDTVVLAFAQVPGEVPVPAQISMAGTTCSYLQQGIVWIDEPTAAIVKLETDLLAPLTDLRLTKLYSVVTFGEVRIPERNLTLWMPNDVEIRWLSKDVAGLERHKYVDYRLFGATSRIVLPE